jgi:hypothetical protein
MPAIPQETQKIISKKTKRFIPAKFLELAKDHDFIDSALITQALLSKDFPRRPGAGKLRPEKEQSYTARSMEYFRCLAEKNCQIAALAQKPHEDAKKTVPNVPVVGQGQKPHEATTKNVANVPVNGQGQTNTPEASAMLAVSKHKTPLRKILADNGSGKGSPRSTPPPNGMVRLTVNVPEELHYRLRHLALERKITLTGLIVAMAEKELAKT